MIHFGGKRPGCCYLIRKLVISKKNLAILISIPFFSKNRFLEKICAEKVELKSQN